MALQSLHGAQWLIADGEMLNGRGLDRSELVAIGGLARILARGALTQSERLALLA